jgi:hypothetical protein
MKKNILLILCLIAIAGCASITAYHLPDRDSKNLGYIYVVHFSSDKRHLERIIADQLISMDYRATCGEEKDIPAEANILVNYIDHWQWDITNYLIELKIEFRTKQDKTWIASGTSNRPSFARRSPEAMVEEILNKILK